MAETNELEFLNTPPDPLPEAIPPMTRNALGDLVSVYGCRLNSSGYRGTWRDQGGTESDYSVFPKYIDWSSYRRALWAQRKPDEPLPSDTSLWPLMRGHYVFLSPVGQVVRVPAEPELSDAMPDPLPETLPIGARTLGGGTVAVTVLTLDRGENFDGRASYRRGKVRNRSGREFHGGFTATGVDWRHWRELTQCDAPAAPSPDQSFAGRYMGRLRYSRDAWPEALPAGTVAGIYRSETECVLTPGIGGRQFYRATWAWIDGTHEPWTGDVAVEDIDWTRVRASEHLPLERAPSLPNRESWECAWCLREMGWGVLKIGYRAGIDLCSKGCWSKFRLLQERLAAGGTYDCPEERAAIERAYAAQEAEKCEIERLETEQRITELQRATDDAKRAPEEEPDCGTRNWPEAWSNPGSES